MPSSGAIVPILVILLFTTMSAANRDLVHVTFEFGSFSAGGLGSVLNGLLPRQVDQFSVKIIMPFVHHLKKNDTNAMKLMKTLKPTLFAGQLEQNYTVKTKAENFTFGVAKYHVEIANATLDLYMIRLTDVEFPNSTEDQQLQRRIYEDVWKLSIYPFHVRADDLPYDKRLILPLMPVFNLCFNSVAVRLIDDIAQKRETIVNLQGGLTSSVLLFMNTVYKRSPRKWKSVLIFHDYVYFCEAVSDNTVRSFYINESMEDFSSNEYFIPEAYGVRHAHRVVAVSDAMVRSLHFDSSQLVPYPFFVKLRREFFVAIENGKMMAINNNADIKEMSPFFNKNLFEEPLTGSYFLNAKKSAREKVSLELRKLGKYCSHNATYWGVFVGRIDYFKGADYFKDYIRILAENDVCPVILAPAPQNKTVADILTKLDQNHVMIWLPKGEIQTKYGKLARLAGDFSFIPSVCESFGLVALESMLYGMPVVSTGVVGLSDTLRRRYSYPNISSFESLHARFPSVNNVRDYLSDLSVCDQVRDFFVENGYNYKLSKGSARHDIPDFGDFASAISLVTKDLQQITSENNLHSYITALTLEAHCKSWENPRGSAATYAQMYSELFLPKSDPTQKKRQARTEKLNQSQMSLFMDASHNIPECPDLSIGADIIPTEWTRKSDLPIEFRLIFSEFFTGGKKTMMLIECNHSNHAGRQITANGIDSDHFPFILCAIGNSNQLVVDMNNSYVSLPVILPELTHEHVTMLIIELTTAIHKLHRNNLCHGNFTEDSVFVFVPPKNSREKFSVKINLFNQQHVMDVKDCISRDKTAFVELANKMKNGKLGIPL